MTVVSQRSKAALTGIQNVAGLFLVTPTNIPEGTKKRSVKPLRSLRLLWRPKRNHPQQSLLNDLLIIFKKVQFSASNDVVMPSHLQEALTVTLNLSRLECGMDGSCFPSQLSHPFDHLHVSPSCLVTSCPWGQGKILFLVACTRLTHVQWTMARSERICCFNYQRLDASKSSVEAASLTLPSFPKEKASQKPPVSLL